MRQKRENVVVVDLSSTSVKTLIGSFNKANQRVKTFFELHGSHAKTGGISKRGVVSNRRALARSIHTCIDDASKASGYEIEEVHVLFSHPNMRFFRKTVGTKEISSPEGIAITEKWLSQKKRQILETLEHTYRNEKCAYLEVASIIADGEEIVHDPYEHSATKSLALTYLYILVPATFIETILESVEQSVTVHIAQPAVVTNGMFLSEEQREQGGISCDIGAETTTIGLYKNNMLVGAHTCPFGGNTITNDIALSEKIAIEEAEKIKLSLSGEEPLLKKKAWQAIDRRIADHLKRHILPYIKEVDPDKSFPGGVVLLGGGAQYKDMDRIVEKALGLYTTTSDTDWHAQNRNGLTQNSWCAAYAFLHSITTSAQEGSATTRKPTSLWQRVMRVMHTIAKVVQ
ncbi:MAG: pilus assembly protein PilM [Candidatus Kaiserbacteria bacterium]|nr:pilus assembly protein PilM [Candidatus Kaiserbacteria bacterium]